MAAPSYSVAQFPHRNPGASDALLLTLIIVPNTSVEEIVANITANASLPNEWLIFQKETAKPAIMVGGGPSAVDHLDQIRAMQEAGGVIFSMNGSTRWLCESGIIPDFQVIADAKEETATLVFQGARRHLFSSAVNPKTMNAVLDAIVWHPVIEGIENCFPEHRRTAEYSLVGGASAGAHAMCVGYVLGHRTFHCFGYDSSHRDGESHAYRQPMNDSIPNVDVEWAGKSYLTSIAMKAQAEQFPVTARAMQNLGCRITVHGDGLLPAMWNTPVADLTERDKYRLMWQHDTYRVVSPGEHIVDHFLYAARPSGRIVDFGCGTGRAALKMAAQGHDVLLVDFADNCRDHEAIRLPFLEWDLTKSFTFKAPYGFCTDVLEHIPPDDVETVVRNIMACAEKCFFQISTVPDRCGALIGTPLHLSVHHHDWWANFFHAQGFEILWEREGETASCFYLKSNRSN